MGKRTVSVKSHIKRIEGVQITSAQLPDTEEPFDFDRKLSTYITKIGPLNNEGVPLWIEMELWAMESGRNTAKKVKKLKFLREQIQ